MDSLEANPLGICRRASEICTVSVATIDLGEARALPADRRRAGLVAAFLVACGIAVGPFILVPLGVSYSLFAVVIALSIAAIAITAVLLWAQARVPRSVPLSVLALGYGLTAIVMLPYMVFRRGLWPELSQWVSADPQTSGWLYIEWHAIFIAATIAYFVARKRPAPAPAAPAFKTVQRRLLWAGAAIVLVTVPPLIWIDGLPALLAGGHVTGISSIFVAAIALGALAAIATAYRTSRFSTLLDLWLSVACFSMLADVMLWHFSHEFAVGWYASRISILIAANAVLFVLLFQTANIYGQLAVTAERLRQESLTDVVTGIANRRSFDLRFGEMLRACKRETRPIALLIADIDQFKAYNDTFGHQAGDECLRSIATLVRGNVGRASDLVARIGGEELAIIMPEVDVIGALVVAERMRHAVEAAAIPQGAGTSYLVVTISVGVAATSDPAGATVQELFNAADRALYRAKESGRNRVVEAVKVIAY